MPNSQMPPMQEGEGRRRKAPKRGRFMRFMRGYLMIVGGMTTIYVLIQLLVLLFVEIGKWMPTQPML